MGSQVQVQCTPHFFLIPMVDYIHGTRTFTLVEESSTDNTLSFYGYGLAASVKTPFGPIQVALGRNTHTGNWNTNFTAGFPFF